MIGYTGGYRHDSNGSFYNLGNNGEWWSSTPGSATTAYGRELHYTQAGVRRIDNWNKSNGFSVRCVRNLTKALYGFYILGIEKGYLYN